MNGYAKWEFHLIDQMFAAQVSAKDSASFICSLCIRKYSMTTLFRPNFKRSADGKVKAKLEILKNDFVIAFARLSLGFSLCFYG